MRKSRVEYVVITESRVFLFGSHALALRFERRARRLPSQRGKSIEFVAARLFQGAR